MNDENVDYKLTCIKCGSRKNLAIFPHRNEQNHIIGIIFSCDVCASQVGGGYLKMEFKEVGNE